MTTTTTTTTRPSSQAFPGKNEAKVYSRSRNDRLRARWCARRYFIARSKKNLFFLRQESSSIFCLCVFITYLLLCCAKTARAEETETQTEDAIKMPPAGLGGIQRGQCRTEYADGVFNVKTCGRRGLELQINTHLVKTEADFEFWRDVRCREKLFVGNENGEIIDVGETLREAKITLGEMKAKMVNLKA